MVTSSVPSSHYLLFYHIFRILITLFHILVISFTHQSYFSQLSYYLYLIHNFYTLVSYHNIHTHITLFISWSHYLYLDDFFLPRLYFSYIGHIIHTSIIFFLIWLHSLCLRWCLFFGWIEKAKYFGFFYSVKSNSLTSINIIKLNLLIINSF